MNVNPGTHSPMLGTPGARGPVLIVAVLLGGTGCHAAPAAPPAPIALAPGAGVVGPSSATAIAEADAAAGAYTEADVEFMTGMIPHHAQAVVMAGWCPSHGARRDLRALCERIIISQQDEIRFMRQWLADRGEVAPDSLATRRIVIEGGTTREILMPGMLTDEEMAALDAARGPEFDVLFLTGMIRHHQGAIDMVQHLFDQPPAGQEETVFRFASDVMADQAAEIQRMQVMLDAVPR
jgi:uncharacterized protein (DUF305 family)